MDSNLPLATGLLTTQMLGGAMLIPGVFASLEEENDLLSSLDSDTRDYVIKHTNEFRSRADIIKCVDRLRKGS